MHWTLRRNRTGVRCVRCVTCQFTLTVFSPSRPLEYPDWVESADSDVADITELEKPDRPEAGLEKRPGAWPLHLSSSQEQVESGLALLLAVEQLVLPLTTREYKHCVYTTPASSASTASVCISVYPCVCILTVCVCVFRLTPSIFLLHPLKRTKRKLHLNGPVVILCILPIG